MLSLKTLSIFFLSANIITNPGVFCAKPIVELSLTGSAAHGPLSDAIASAESGFNGRFVSSFAQLDSAYSQVLAESSVLLEGTMIKALGSRPNNQYTSFLQAWGNIIEPTIAVRAMEGKSDEGAAVYAIQQLETKNNQAESAMIQSAKKEFQDLAKVVIGEFDKQIRSQKGTSFLKFNREVNIRLLNDPNYDSIATMLSGFQSRRDNSMNSLKAKILSLEMKLVQNLNKIGEATLGY